MQQLGVGEGYAELTGGIRGIGTQYAAFVRGELGYKPTGWLDTFAFGEAQLQKMLVPTYMAGIGIRAHW